jgi:hypothetical protein
MEISTANLQYLIFLIIGVLVLFSIFLQILKFIIKKISNTSQLKK